MGVWEREFALGIKVVFGGLRRAWSCREAGKWSVEEKEGVGQRAGLCSRRRSTGRVAVKGGGMSNDLKRWPVHPASREGANVRAASTCPVLSVLSVLPHSSTHTYTSHDRPRFSDLFSIIHVMVLSANTQSICEVKLSGPRGRPWHDGARFPASVIALACPM